jgi:peptidoglycan glycosyltransferase
LLCLLIVAHLATRRLARVTTATLLPLVARSNGIGYVIIALFDDRAPASIRRGSSSASSRSARRCCSSSGPPIALGTVDVSSRGCRVAVLPSVPGIGKSFGGARIWVSVGPINFQPGEFAKIALALFFAGYLAERRELIATGRGRWGRCASPSRVT